MNVGDVGLKNPNLSDVQASMIFEGGLKKEGIHEGMQYGGCFMGQVDEKSYNKTYEMRKKVYAKLNKGPRDSVTDEFASSTTYSSTSGNLPIFPIYVSPEIIDLTQKAAPLYEMLPKRAVRGKFIDFNQKTSKKGASFKFENAAQAATDMGITRKSIEVKFAYSVGKVSGPAVAIYAAYTNILQMEILDATQSLVELLENKIITGDASTNAEEFSGLDVLITTNTEDQSGASVTLAKIREYIRYARQGGSTVTGTGRPNLMVTNYATFDDLKALIQPWQRYNDTNTLMWGIQSFSIDGIAVMADPFAVVTASSRRIYILDMSTWYLGVLQDITYEELAKVDDSNKFMVKWYGALTCTAEKYNAMIYGIA